MAPASSLASRLKYAAVVVLPAVILGGNYWIWILNIGALIYTDFGTPERREKYKEQQDEYERISRERRLARRRQKALEEEQKKKEWFCIV